MSRNRHEMGLLRLAPYVSGARGRPDFKIHRLKAAAAAGLTAALSLSARHLWCPWAPILSFGGRPEGANSIPLWSAAKRSRPACFNASIRLAPGHLACGAESLPRERIQIVKAFSCRRRPELNVRSLTQMGRAGIGPCELSTHDVLKCARCLRQQIDYIRR